MGIFSQLPGCLTKQQDPGKLYVLELESVKASLTAWLIWLCHQTIHHTWTALTSLLFSNRTDYDEAPTEK